MPERWKKDSWSKRCRKFEVADNFAKEWLKKILSELIRYDLWLREKSVKSYVSTEIFEVSQRKPSAL